jgi:hypothetical protein
VVASSWPGRSWTGNGRTEAGTATGEHGLFRSLRTGEVIPVATVAAAVVVGASQAAPFASQSAEQLPVEAAFRPVFREIIQA